jgi:hypothetical protein
MAWKETSLFDSKFYVLKKGVFFKNDKEEGEQEMVP